MIMTYVMGEVSISQKDFMYQFDEIFEIIEEDLK